MAKDICGGTAGTQPIPSTGTAGIAGGGSGTAMATTMGNTYIWMDKGLPIGQVIMNQSLNPLTKSNNTITPPRCKIYQEWRDSTPRRADEEPDICEYVVKVDPGNNWMEWSAHLTWERWCAHVSPDGDIDTAFARLKSLARGQYRLQKSVGNKPKTKYNSCNGNCLMFFTEEAARAVMAEFTKAIGKDRLVA